MRILKLPLAGLLFCVMALFAGCKTSNEPKAPVALTWEMGASDIEPGYYENTFILKNISQKPLKKNWTIYYSQLPRGVKQEGASEVKVEVVNGNFSKCIRQTNLLRWLPVIPCGLLSFALTSWTGTPMYRKELIGWRLWMVKRAVRCPWL